MKVLGWYGFVIVVISILYWVPSFLSGNEQWETGLWVIILFVPVAVYILKTLKQVK